MTLEWMSGAEKILNYLSGFVQYSPTVSEIVVLIQLAHLLRLAGVFYVCLFLITTSHVAAFRMVQLAGESLATLVQSVTDYMSNPTYKSLTV